MPISLKNILTPVDFSPRAEDSVQYAGRLARHYHSGLTMLHVVEPVHVDYAMAEMPGFADRVASSQRERAQLQLDRFATADVAGLEVRRIVCQGRPAEEILIHAREADLVVMPTQGHGRVREFLLGSVTAKVLHDCVAPVLTGIHLSGPELPDWTVARILCAIDFGPETPNVLKWGSSLAHEFGAVVTVIHASSDSHALARLNQEIKVAGLQAASLVVAGEPSQVVTSAAKDYSADLLVIGRGSSDGTLGRLRAQAYAIVRQSPCPVLSV